MPTARTLSLTSPAMPLLMGAPALEITHVSGGESLSQLYSYTLEVSTPDNPSISPHAAANVNYKQLVGKEAAVSIQLDGQGSFIAGAAGTSGAANIGRGARHLTGLITAASYIRSEDRRAIYQLTLEPWLTLTQHSSDFRIFQSKSALEIIREILSKYNYPCDNHCTGTGLGEFQNTYPPLDYQVQYGESDYEFVTRLMSEWGIYYYFQHSADAKNPAAKASHRMVLVDTPSSHPPTIQAPSSNPRGQPHAISYFPPGHKIDEEHLNHWARAQSLQTGEWITTDYDFRQPKANLAQRKAMPRDTGHAQLQHYSYPNDSLNVNKANLSPADTQNQNDTARHLTRVRMEHLGGLGHRSHASGNLRGLATGTTFRLVRHPTDQTNGEYLVIASHIDIQEIAQHTGGYDFSCTARITVQPASDIYRSAPLAKPSTKGPQSAVVTGPAGREIYTDPYGRVKISFPWNRYCTHDEHSSCWVRVSSPWAGTNFGGIHIPRIGQEVIVDFEHGDPDRPLITGRVYNRMNMPPWELPAHQTQSGVLTRSSEGGGKAHANALRFEDLKGEEEVWLHAERNLRTEVENNESHAVTKNRNKTVGGGESASVGGSRSHSVGKEESIQIKLDQTTAVGQNIATTAGQNISVTAEKGAIVLTAKESIELRCGASTLRLDKEGNILINGVKVKIVGSDRIDLNP